MASGVEFTFDYKQVEHALKTLPINIQKNIMVGATRAGAVVVVNKAKEYVPENTGNLKKYIGVTKRRSKGKNEVVFSVSPRRLKNLGGFTIGTKYSKFIKDLKDRKKAGGYYGRFIELGTSKMHAQPFLRPALENSVHETLVAAKDYIAKRLPEEVAKAKR
jgi:HK97 gp10 family phage protein